MGTVIFGAFRQAAPETSQPAKREGEIDRFPTREAFEEFRRSQIAANPYDELIGQRLESHRLIGHMRRAVACVRRPQTVREWFTAILAARL